MPPATPSGVRLAQILVEHLDELRSRLIVSLAAIVAAFAVCFWQSHSLLHLVNKPLATQTQKQVRAGHAPLGVAYTNQQNTRTAATRLARGIASLDQPTRGRHASNGVPHSMRSVRGSAKRSNGCPRHPRATSL